MMTDDKTYPVINSFMRQLRELMFTDIQQIYRVGYHHPFSHRLLFTANMADGECHGNEYRCLDCSHAGINPFPSLTRNKKNTTKTYWLRINGKWSQIA